MKHFFQKVRSRHYLKSALTRFYISTIKPKSVDEEDARKEFILNIILTGTLYFLTILELFLIIQFFKGQLVFKNSNPIFFSGIFILFLILYTLSRKGYSLFASYGLIALYSFAVTYAAFCWGPDLYQVLVSYALIIIMTGILTNQTFTFFITISISSVIIGLNYLNQINFISFNTSWRSEGLLLNDTIELTLTYCMMYLITWLSNREINSSLKRARYSEKALVDRNNSLEETVQERTRELQNSQIERVSNLYRFVEFGRLSSGVFHDLINPLSVINLNFENLKQNKSPELKPLKKSLAQAIEASQRMENLITDAKKQLSTNGSKEYFSPTREIRSVINLLKYKITKYKITINYTPKNYRDFQLHGDITRFSQIITNLISNAIDSYEKLGERNDRVIKITLQKTCQDFLIHIADNGCGISEKILDNIFNPFFTTKDRHRGIGLGLSTTKTSLEKDFGGKILVRSEENKGSTFTIIFPFIN